MSTTMPSYIPPQYHDPRFIQVDPDNNDPDVYDVETGEIINTETGKVVGMAKPGQKDYNGSKEDLDGVSYKKKDIENNTSNVTSYLEKQMTGLNGKIKDLQAQFDKEQDPIKKGLIEDQIFALNDTKKSLQTKIDNIKNAKTPEEKKKAVEDATTTSIEVDKILGGNTTPSPQPSSPTTPSKPSTTSRFSDAELQTLSDKIYEAMKGAGTDTDKVKYVIGMCTTPDGKLDKGLFDQLRTKYAQDHGQDLLTDLKEDLTDKEEYSLKEGYGLDVNNYDKSNFRLEGYVPPKGVDPFTPEKVKELSENLYDSMSGAGTNTEKLRGALGWCSTPDGKLDRESFEQLRREYARTHNQDLLRDMREDLTDEEEAALKIAYGLDVNNYENSNFK
ncbi:hypothetical protein D3870_21170 [Noviherbaspirillum cavernae]|uniref:Uncharacterized protein n=1 Tax=Noviherbaspirillum cavernae TaxID=2320862 RepID=A0A418WWB0_9BURK|nr:hypothetical protein [Noviherbaspirillum cavernae]RJF96889.1 hypothetical protein D3870_21170 [Noviherbaspirillum cavernae]